MRGRGAKKSNGGGARGGRGGRGSQKRARNRASNLGRHARRAASDSSSSSSSSEDEAAQTRSAARAAASGAAEEAAAARAAEQERLVEERRASLESRRRRASAGGSLNEAELQAAAWPKSQWSVDTTVRETMAYIQKKAGTAAHRTQVIEALFQNALVVQTLQAAGLVTPVCQAICAGLAERMRQIRAAGLHLTSGGRLVYNGIAGAAVNGLKYVRHGMKEVYARTIGISRQKMHGHVQREERLAKVGEVLLLDPTRAKRKDATPVSTIDAIQQCWKQQTKASPDKKPSVKLTLEDGTVVEHGVHWQQKSTKEIFEAYAHDPQNPVVGLTTFTKHKPYFVRKTGFRGCLCPKCFTMRKQLEGFRSLLLDVCALANTCRCSFCKYHKAKHAAHQADPNRDKFETVNYPPESPARLLEAMFCPKKPLREGSGFDGERYPTYDLKCQREYMRNWEADFVDGEGQMFANLGEVEAPKLSGKNTYELSGMQIDYDAPCAHLPSPNNNECVACHEGQDKGDNSFPFAHTCTAGPGCCSDCGESKFPIRPPSHCEFVKAEGTVTFIDMEDVPRRSGKENATREEACEKTLSRKEFLEGFLDYFSVYLLHKYIADWQDAVGEIVTKKQRENHQLIGWDFGMNYTAVAGEELKGGFFEREQISLHTVLTYGEWPHEFLKLSHPSGKERAPRMMQIFVYFSDDKHHDATYVLDNAEHLLDYLHKQREEFGLEPLRSVGFLSDGGPGHYKQGRNFFNMCKLVVTGGPKGKRDGEAADSSASQPEIPLPWSIVYDFLAPDHGKSAWDGITGVVKMQLMAAEVAGYKPALSNAERVVAYLSHPDRQRKKDPEHLNAPFNVDAGSSFSAEFKHFVLTKSDDLEKRRATEGDVGTVDGTRSHFSFAFDRVSEGNTGELRMRWLSCPCEMCASRSLCLTAEP